MAAVDPRVVPPPGEKVLPKPGQRNVLITSALPYVNNVPHLGNIIGCVLSGDVYARFCRQRSINAVYICGTDEYGTATETKAREEKLTEQQICDKYHAIHADVYRWFNIRFDHFGRTTTPQQTEISQDIFLNLHRNGFLKEDSVTQLYCENCKKFLADRYVEGTCPYCKYDDARGDQCDKCGKLLDPTQLVNPKCKICSNAPVVRSSEHVFLDLPAISQDLERWFEKTSSENKWTSNSIGITKTWLATGLNPRCITRDLRWGTPVPLEKFKNKVFYVWFDAPIGYISITANYTTSWESWWKNPENVELYQFMGKDNVPFHTVMFPCSLIGSKTNWTLLHTLSTTEYLNYEDSRFSKSRGVGVFGDTVQDTNIPSEVYRYYLLVNRPEASDTVFSWKDFVLKNNTELLANLGNFVNRLLKFVFPANNYNATVPALGALEERDQQLIREVNEKLGEYLALLNGVHLKDGIRKLMEISTLGNIYLQDTAPFNLIKTNRARCDTVVVVALHLIHLIATLAAPFMPSLADKILHQLGVLNPAVQGEQHPLIPDQFAVPNGWFPTGHKINEPAALFRKISDEEEEALRTRFAGNQAQQAAGGAAAAAAAAGPAAPRFSPAEVAALEAAVTNQKTVVAKLKADAGATDPATVAAVAVLKTLIQYFDEASGKVPEKGDKGKKDKGAKAAAGAPKEEKKPEVKDPNMCPLDLRVGVVLEARAHGSADKLLVMQVDLGEGRPRQICGGMVGHYTPEQLVGKRVVAVANLEPLKLKGEESQGMLLAAVQGDQTALIAAPEDAPAGAVVLGRGQTPNTSTKAIAKKVFASLSFGIAGGAVVFMDKPLETVSGTPVSWDKTKTAITDGSKVQ